MRKERTEVVPCKEGKYKVIKRGRPGRRRKTVAAAVLAQCFFDLELDWDGVATAEAEGR